MEQNLNDHRAKQEHQHGEVSQQLGHLRQHVDQQTSSMQQHIDVKMNEQLAHIERLLLSNQDAKRNRLE